MTSLMLKWTGATALVVGAMAEETQQLRGSMLSSNCEFDNEPEVQYFWDEACVKNASSLGCLADGIHPECRFCGSGDYSEIYCPAGWCEFDNPPNLPYYWDADCRLGGLGCLADGRHEQCRFCGEFPYNGTVLCPAKANAIVPTDACRFDDQPEHAFYWDETCLETDLGCKADGKHIGCRFCGSGDYASIPCPSSLCTFEAAGLLMPADPHRFYWEPACWSGDDHILGCHADGVHFQCRYCGSGEYENVTCPAWASE